MQTTPNTRTNSTSSSSSSSPSSPPPLLPPLRGTKSLVEAVKVSRNKILIVFVVVFLVINVAYFADFNSSSNSVTAQQRCHCPDDSSSSSSSRRWRRGDSGSSSDYRGFGRSTGSAVSRDALVGPAPSEQQQALTKTTLANNNSSTTPPRLLIVDTSPPRTPSTSWASHERTTPFLGPALPDSADIFNWLISKPEQQVRTNMTHRARDVPMAIALRQFRQSDYDSEITVQRASDVICNLVMLQTRNCDAFRESLVDCVRRFGKGNWEKILGTRCTANHFWDKILPRLLNKTRVVRRRRQGRLASGLSATTTPQPTPAPPPPKRVYGAALRQKNLYNYYRSRGQPVPQSPPDDSHYRLSPQHRRLFKNHVDGVDADGNILRTFSDNNNNNNAAAGGDDEYIVEQEPYKDTTDPEGWRRMKRGNVFDSMMLKNEDCVRYIPPNERSIAEFPPPRVCTGKLAGCVHYPIGFGLPRSYFIDRVPRTKSFDWMPMMPRHTPSDKRYSAKIQDEDLFRELYTQSFFSWTAARAGVDALRHYEIIAAGSVPFFFDINQIPRNSVGHLPRSFLRSVLKIPGVEHIMAHGHDYTRPNMYGGVNFKRQGTINATRFNISRYYEIADELLEYGKRYLTAPAITAYLLRSVGVEEPGRGERKGGILYFGRFPFDYIDVTLLTGFTELGIKVTLISTPKEYLFKQRTENGTMTRADRDKRLDGFKVHGGGFGFAMRMNPDVITPRPFMEKPTPQTRQDILDKKYDLIVYSLTGEQPYYFVDEAKKSGTKIAFLQYRDGHGDPENPETWKACHLGGPVFIREMSDKECLGEEKEKPKRRHY